MNDETVEAIRAMIRAEFRRCGLRPPPPGPGAWRWDPAADAWVALLEESAEEPAVL